MTELEWAVLCRLWGWAGKSGDWLACYNYLAKLYDRTEDWHEKNDLSFLSDVVDILAEEANDSGGLEPGFLWAERS